MRIRILLLALLVHQGWTHPQSYSYGSTSEAAEPENQNSNPERDGDSSKRIIGSSVVTSVSVILNGNEPEFTDALGMKVPKPQVPHLQVASPINLLNPDRYEFYTFNDNGDLIKRLMTMEEIQSIVANGDGEGPTIIHSAPIDDRDPEKNVQDIVKSVQSVLNREVESNKNASDIQPILDTPDVSSSWSMILPAIFGNTGGDIFPQNKPQQVVMTPDSDVVETTTKSNKRKPSSKPKPHKKKNGSRRKTTTQRPSTTTPIPEPETTSTTEVLESTTRRVFINNQEFVQQSTEAAQLQHGQQNSAKRRPGVHPKPSSNHAGAKRPQSNKQKTKTKRPTTAVPTTTPEPVTEPITTTQVPTTTTSTTTIATTTVPAPTTAAPAVIAEDTVVKEKPPQKKRKKPTRKPSTTEPIVEATTERHHSGHHHKKKQTTVRPPFYFWTIKGPHVSVTASPTPTPKTTTTTTTTTPAPIPTSTTTPVQTTTTTTTTTTPAPTTTTTTTTLAPPTTTTTTPEPTTTTPTTTPAPLTTTTTTPFTFATTAQTSAPYHPPITAAQTSAPYRPPATSTTTTAVPYRPPSTTAQTSAPYHPPATTITTAVPYHPPITTAQTSAPYHPPANTTAAPYRPSSTAAQTSTHYHPPATTTSTAAPTTTSTTTSTTTTTVRTSPYVPTTTTTRRPYYSPILMNQQLFEGFGINPVDFAPSLKKQPIFKPGHLTEKEEDINTKLSFDQILQSLKEESVTDDTLEASESEENPMAARLPPTNYPTADSLLLASETPSPIRDFPMTISSGNFEAYDELDELTSRPITQGKPLDSYESLENASNDSEKRTEEEEEEGPLVIITSRPQHHISGRPGLPISKTPEATTTFYEPEATTIQAEQDLQDSSTARIDDAVTKGESSHTVKFEPHYVEVPEPVLTTLTTTTTESPPTTVNDEYPDTNEEDTTVESPTTLPPMESIMQKIDAIISMSLKPNGTLQMNNGHIQQSVPHISTMTMKDFKTQAATVASILEDNNTSQSSETTVMNSSETKDEIEFLLSDVINQMTQSQPPNIATTAMPNIVAAKPQPLPSSSQEETAHRLSNFAQINPALQISAEALKQTLIRQPTADESIKTAAPAPKGDSKPQDLNDESSDDSLATTEVVENGKESSSPLIPQGNDHAQMSLENTPEQEEDQTNAPSEEESATPAVFHTTQRAYISSEENSKEQQSSEEKAIPTTVKPNLISEESTEEDGSEQMIVVTSAPEVPEEEKSTEIPGETAVVYSDSDMEESYETPEFTTIIPALQTGSHLLEGEDPYVKLGEIGAKPTIQSLAQMIYGQNAKIEEKSEEAEKGKIDENPVVQESDILQKIDDEDSEEPTKAATLESQIDEKSSEKLSAETPTAVSIETTEVPQMIQVIQPSKKPMMNMAQVALEQALMYATKVPLDFEDDRLATTQTIEAETTTAVPEILQQATETTQLSLVTKEKTSSTQAVSTTIPTKKVPNTLKPVSYFNKQPGFVISEQKFNAFQAAQQRPMVRPASLSNLKMPQSSAARPPVKLDPSPAGSLGLEVSTTGLDDDLRQFTQLCNELAFTYWRSITSEKISSARSLIISPFALTSMLSMVFLGARGSTSGEMNEVLKLDDMVTFNPHLVFKNITDSVEKATDSEIASSAFVREAFSDRANGKILQFFKEKTQQFYSGHVEEVNFHVVNDIIRRRTNLLVKRHTMGKVLEYLRTNSVWVNGPLATISANLFQTDCSRASISDRDGEMFFQVHPSIRQRRLVPIPAVLYKSGFTAGYEPNLDATVVAFGRPYDTVNTIYVMPGQQGPIAPADSLDILEKKLIETAFTKHAWFNILTSVMERQGLEVQLPRFSHRSFVNASMGLQKMGLKGLFKSDLADLRGLTGLAAKDIYLSDMIQINTFSTCAEEKIGEHHHVEMYPAPPIRKRNKDMRENEDGEGDSSESVIDFGSIVQDASMARAFYDDLLDPKFLELPLPLRPRQARIPDAPRLRFDRPFLYFVRHNPTGMILFMGRFNPRLLP